MVFREPEITKGLKLEYHQQKQIRSIEAEAFCGYWNHIRLGGPPQKTAMEKILTVVLTQEQVKRWKEMTGEPFQGAIPTFIFGPGKPFGWPR